MLNTCSFFFFVSFFLSQEKQYVGFATLPNQVHRKSVKKGFDFTLMVAGQFAAVWANRSENVCSNCFGETLI